MRHASLAAASLLVALATTARAQNDDSVFAGRRCDRRLANLRLPALQEIGDSAVLDGALRVAAREQQELTVWFTYDRSGQVKSIFGEGPKETRRALEAAARTTARPLPGFPNKFSVGVARFADGHLEVAPGMLTCQPEAGPTEDAIAFIKQSADYTQARGRKTVVMFWLESDGRITAPQIVRGSGVPSLDLLALAAIKRITYKPPLVGRTPVRALMQQPFHF